MWGACSYVLVFVLFQALNNDDRSSGRVLTCTGLCHRVRNTVRWYWRRCHPTCCRSRARKPVADSYRLQNTRNRDLSKWVAARGSRSRNPIVLTDVLVARSEHNVLVYSKYVSTREIIGPTASHQIPDGRPLRVGIVIETPSSVACVESHL